MSIRMSLAALSSFAALSLGGCVDVYTKAPLGYYTYGNQRLTADLRDYEDRVLKPLCVDYSKHTNPSDRAAAGAGAWNNFITGGLAGSGAYKAEAWTVGVSVGAKAVLASGLGEAIPAGMLGGVGGWTSNKMIEHSEAKNCVAAALGGYHYLPPSYAKDHLGESFGMPDKIRDGALDSNSEPPPPPPTPANR